MTENHHDCQYEQQIQGQSRKIAELETHIDFKDKRIDELIEDQRRMEEKVDNIAEAIKQLQIQSLQDDKDIDRRVTSLESTVNVLKYITTLLFGSGIIWVVLKII